MATETETAAHGADAARGTAEAVQGGAEAVGMPQLDFSTFPNQIFWLVVTLVVVYLILSRLALPRLASVLAERQDTIGNDIAAAEELKLQAEQAGTAYNQALADARAGAQKIVAEAKAGIQADVNAAIARADAEIAARAAESEKAISDIRAGAMDNVREVANATAGDIVAAMGGKADARTIADAIGAQMKGWGR